MSDDNVIKFGKAKKALARADKTKRAEINRARHGQKKAAREEKRALTEKLRKKLDGHKRDKPD